MPPREGASRSGKRWVRPENPSSDDTPEDELAQSNATSNTSVPNQASTNPTSHTHAEQAQDEQATTSPAKPAAETFNTASAVGNATSGADARTGFARTKAKGNKKGKRWVRPESPVSPPPPTQESAQESGAEAAPVEAPDTTQHQPEPVPEQPQSTENSDATPPAGTGQD
jgi:hypothetical protein